MTERSGRTDHDPDDWFDPDAWGRDPAEPAEATREAEQPDTAAAVDDWLGTPDVPQPRRRWERYGRRIRTPQAAAAAALVACLFVGLALAGVFNGGGTKQIATTAPPASSPAAATATQTTTTTTATTAPPVAGPTTTLTPGAKGPQVRALQEALNALGYPVGTVDGVYGTKTQQALAEFQRKSGLAPDGVLGPQTLAALHTALAKAQAP